MARRTSTTPLKDHTALPTRAKPLAQPTGRCGGTPVGERTPGRVNQATRDFCADQAKGVTGVAARARSRDAVQPDAEQKPDCLKTCSKAAQEAAAQFKEACPDAVPMTPPGRLQAMTAAAAGVPRRSQDRASPR